MVTKQKHKNILVLILLCGTGGGMLVTRVVSNFDGYAFIREGTATAVAFTSLVPGLA